MYVGALFSAVSSIFIFKQYRDDGTELIISSKPLTRKVMIITKFVLYISFCLTFSLVASMIG
jgi:ABC-type transport system involved in multi-copper enzyme maturation permease subunit